MTNFEKIKQMNAEQLASFLDCSLREDEDFHTMIGFNTFLDTSDIVEWLNSEFDGDFTISDTKAETDYTDNDTDSDFGDIYDDIYDNNYRDDYVDVEDDELYEADEDEDDYPDIADAEDTNNYDDCKDYHIEKPSVKVRLNKLQSLFKIYTSKVNKGLPKIIKEVRNTTVANFSIRLKEIVGATMDEYICLDVFDLIDDVATELKNETITLD